MASSGLAAAAAEALRDCDKWALFDAGGAVLAANFKPSDAELQALVKLLDDREAAIRGGMVVGGERHEVHRFHPPLAYGRTMGCAPDASVGAALCKVEPSGGGGKACFGFITYRMPNLSARMVPILQEFCEQHLKGGGGGAK